MLWWVQFISWIWKRILQPHPSNVPPKRIMHPDWPAELLFNQRLFYMIIVIIRQCPPTIYPCDMEEVKMRQGSLPFRGIWKKSPVLLFEGCLHQKRTSNQPSKSPPLHDSVQRAYELRGFLIITRGLALITNSDKICINMSILGSHLSHKENKEMFTLHTSQHPELHPFGDKTPGKYTHHFTSNWEC